MGSCHATREAVQEQIYEGEIACPLCDSPPESHPPETIGESPSEDVDDVIEELWEVQAERDRAQQLVEIARITAEHWRDAFMSEYSNLRACAHPLALVIAALNGETDPDELGLDPGSLAEAAVKDQRNA